MTGGGDDAGGGDGDGATRSAAGPAELVQPDMVRPRGPRRVDPRPARARPVKGASLARAFPAPLGRARGRWARRGCAVAGADQCVGGIVRFGRAVALERGGGAGAQPPLGQSLCTCLIQCCARTLRCLSPLHLCVGAVRAHARQHAQVVPVDGPRTSEEHPEVTNQELQGWIWYGPGSLAAGLSACAFGAVARALRCAARDHARMHVHRPRFHT